VATAAIIGPADGSAVAALDMVHKVHGHHLDGQLLIMEGMIAPGVMIIPHTHTLEDECAFVLSGELTYLLGDEVYLARSGSYVVRPRGIRHAFWNATTEPARVMEIHTPATFERFYDEFGDIFAEFGPPGAPGMRMPFDELSTRYGLVQHWDMVPALVERYGIGRP
jgi:quercetin dioxygenase-like cupin family protein